MKQNGVSVIICCFNSSNRIGKTLEYLSKQKELSNIKWEIIIVDNNSTDNTSIVAKKTWDELNKVESELRVVVEKKTGLNFAREKGISISNYNYVIFCDDDNWLNENYIFKTFQFLNENDEYAVVGGNGVERTEIEPPVWFEKFKSMYAIGCRNNGEVKNVYGAGMGIKKKLLKSFKPLISDRKGKSLISGGDSEICHFLTAKGYKIQQLCDNQFFHFIPKERLTLRYLQRLAEGRGKSKAMLDVLYKNNLSMKYRFKNHLLDLFTAFRTVNVYRVMFLTIYIYNYWKQVYSKKENFIQN